MKLRMSITRIILIASSVAYITFAKASVLTSQDKHKVLYETDGHYWTVLVVATMLNIQEAKTIATIAEFPDNVMNQDGYIVRSRFTFLYPKPQTKVHALTGGNPEYERLISFNWIRVAQTPEEKGIACHRLGDSFAHTNDKKGKMFPHLVAHLFQWKKPDKIATNSNKYLEYVRYLVSALGGNSANIDMEVFEYIARAGLSSDRNAAILKAEYHRMIGSLAFNIDKDDLPVVEEYLNNRVFGDAYAVHINSEKKLVSTTVIFFRNESITKQQSIQSNFTGKSRQP